MKEVTQLPVAIIAHPIYAEHLTGWGHPESPHRYVALIHALETAGLKTPINTLPPRLASQEEILLCHTSEYYHLLQSEIQKIKVKGIPNEIATLSTGDVQICAASWEVALMAVGGVLSGVDSVMQKKARRTFCAVRPPGHHATRNAGMGFCLFNNAAIGARYVQEKYGISRVLIADWDVHHGNGTQDIFEEDPHVFYFSTHQSRLYPGTGHAFEKGKNKGLGTLLNCPIEASPKSQNDVLEAFEKKLSEAMEIFRPEFIIISAGFDAHRLDPLGGLNLEDSHFSRLTHCMTALANHYAEGRIVSVLEGGYNLTALATATVSHVKALAEP